MAWELLPAGHRGQKVDGARALNNLATQAIVDEFSARDAVSEITAE